MVLGVGKSCMMKLLSHHLKIKTIRFLLGTTILMMPVTMLNVMKNHCAVQ